MHNLAIAMKLKGYHVTGSDDEIFEPSLSRLKHHGLLPEYNGWNPDIITNQIDAIVLGMHARPDNPELVKAKALGLKIYSYPEYLYEQSKHKARIVVGGSHGKTTITSMIMHVLKHLNYNFDYMVGAQLKGFDNMVSFSEESKLAVFEGDEYLTSPIDPRPKFHVYQPNIAIISGISWDHVNVFPTFDVYRQQFERFLECIVPNGTIIYCADDPEVCKVVEANPRTDLKRVPYHTHPYEMHNGVCRLIQNHAFTELKVFGKHNMQNIAAAKCACNEVGVDDLLFYSAIASFEGAAKRLQLLAQNSSTSIYLDFAHSPSKVKATVEALLQQSSIRKLVVCFELHTFSSLTRNFLKEYKGTLLGADKAYVFYNPHTVEMKKLPPFEPVDVIQGFDVPNLDVFTNSNELVNDLLAQNLTNRNLLIMTSGNFAGVDLQQLAKRIVG